MTFAPGNIVRLTVRQEYDSQECLNVFYYEMNELSAWVGTAAELAEEFWITVQENWRTLVSTAVTFDRVVIENLDGTLDFGEYVIEGAQRAGEFSGIPTSSFACFAIQLNRTNRLVRPGSKRLVGVTEEHIANYGVLTPGILTHLQLVADDFATDVQSGIVTVMNPVIVGFPNINRAERVAVPIDTATAKTIISTQNTRKRGSGS